MKNKVIAALAAFFLLTPLALTAMGSNEKGSGSGEKVTLEFWTWRTEDVEFYEKVIQAFEKKPLKTPSITQS